MARSFLADVIEQFGSGIGRRVESVDERVTRDIDSFFNRMRVGVARGLLYTSFLFRVLVLVRLPRTAGALLVLAAIPILLLRLIAKQERLSPGRFTWFWRGLPGVATVALVVTVLLASDDLIAVVYLIVGESLNYSGRRIKEDAEHG